MELEMNIQIMKIYKESFHDVRSHKKEWMRVASGPLLVWALGAILLGVAYMSGGHSVEMHKAFTGEVMVEQEGSAFLSFAQFVYGLTYFIAMTSLYINGYRYAILHEGGRSGITLNLNMRFVKMVLYTILFGILGGLYIAASAGIIFAAHVLVNSIAVDVILGIFLGMYAFYLMFRIVLFPVVISMDQNAPLKTSWSLMRSNALRYLGLSLLVMLTITLIGLLGAIVVGLLVTVLGMLSPILLIFSVMLGLLFAIFMVLLGWAVNSKVMGLVYQELSTKTKSS